MEKINEAYLRINNDYSGIVQEYKRLTGDEMNKAPDVSVEKYPLQECKYQVSIVIAAWNSTVSLYHTIQSIKRTSITRKFPNKVELVIVDDGSDDGFPEIYNNLKVPFRTVIIQQRHMGRAQAVNLGIYSANGSIIVFCDADIVITPYAIDELIKRQQLFLNEAIFFGFRQDIQLQDLEQQGVDEFLENVVIDLESDNRFLTDFAAGWGTNMMLETNMLMGSTCTKNIYISNNIKSIYDSWPLYRMVYGFLFSISKENIRKLGGFPEYLVGWGCDDTEVAAKALLHNIRLIPVPSAYVFHIYHDIREKTQWEDGRKNEMRMLQHLASLDFPNYLNDSLEQRILHSEVIPTCSAVEQGSRSKARFRCKQKNGEYYYRLCDLNNALSIFQQSDTLSPQEADMLLDILIRTGNCEVFTQNLSTFRDTDPSFMYSMAMYFFKEQVLVNIHPEDEYLAFAQKIGFEQLLKRADLYFDEAQWYLALRDYFACFVLSGFGLEMLQDKYQICKNMMLHQQ